MKFSKWYLQGVRLSILWVMMGVFFLLSAISTLSLVANEAVQIVLALGLLVLAGCWCSLPSWFMDYITKVNKVSK